MTWKGRNRGNWVTCVFGLVSFINGNSLRHLKYGAAPRFLGPVVYYSLSKFVVARVLSEIEEIKLWNDEFFCALVFPGAPKLIYQHPSSHLFAFTSCFCVSPELDDSVGQENEDRHRQSTRHSSPRSETTTLFEKLAPYCVHFYSSLWLLIHFFQCLPSLRYPILYDSGETSSPYFSTPRAADWECTWRSIALFNAMPRSELGSVCVGK